LFIGPERTSLSVPKIVRNPQKELPKSRKIEDSADDARTRERQSFDF